MNFRPIIIRALLLLPLTLLLASPAAAEVDKDDPTFLVLRDSLTHSFNDGDSARFFVAVKNLEDYCLEHDDLHAYYTQRCNEIVFLLNRRNIFEAYKLSTQLSRELRERKLDKELYMAINMMGHIYNYCGNKEMARHCFREVLQRLEKEGYIESMPPIYMNLVQVEIDDNPEEAMRLLDKAEEVATNEGRKTDIATYRTLHCFKTGDMKAFQEGYLRYKEREKEGLNSVHGRALEAYYLASQGKTAEAIQQVKNSSQGDESYDMLAEIYAYAGDWKNAYEVMKQKEHVSDSINSEILSNSMEGIQSELKLYDAERREARQRIIALTSITIGLLVVIIGLIYITLTRRRHMRQLREAHARALESDRMKSAFISNISHEIRTPLNIIGGFMQVMSDPTMEMEPGERKNMADMMLHNTQLITTLVDEMLELALNDTERAAEKNDKVDCLALCERVVRETSHQKKPGVDVQIVDHLPSKFQLTTNGEMLRRILNALMDNAVKYTDKGRITLTLSQQPTAVLFTIDDTGCGIAPEHAERIFERFEKLDEFKDGLGLGLPLARTLAQRLGGNVTLDTTYKQGARFVVKLPLH